MEETREALREISESIEETNNLLIDLETKLFISNRNNEAESKENRKEDLRAFAKWFIDRGYNIYPRSGSEPLPIESSEGYQLGIGDLINEYVRTTEKKT